MDVQEQDEHVLAEMQYAAEKSLLVAADYIAAWGLKTSEECVTFIRSLAAKLAAGGKV